MIKNWLIKLLGGYTYEEYLAKLSRIGQLEWDLFQAQKNDYRDQEGKFAKRPEEK